MHSPHYIGFDLHKKSISICVKTVEGRIVEETKTPSTRQALIEWAHLQKQPWIGIMEATIFTGWVYDTLKPFAAELKVAHPVMAKAITCGKKKNDRVDGGKLADMGRCNWLPECHMMPAAERQLRETLRYRQKLLQETVQFKNIIAGLLLAHGTEYETRRLHRKAYFADLLDQSTDLPESTRRLLGLNRSFMELFNRTQHQLLDQLERHPQVKDRVARLQTIPGVGTVTSLSWALEVGDPQRFSSVRKAISYCGLTSAENSSADKSHRGPISKQRNKHLQRALIEAAHLAPLHNPALKELYEKECQRGNPNRATVVVARKLVAYLLAVDKSGQPFHQLHVEAASNCTVHA